MDCVYHALALLVYLSLARPNREAIIKEIGTYIYLCIIIRDCLSVLHVWSQPRLKKGRKRGLFRRLDPSFVGFLR